MNQTQPNSNNDHSSNDKHIAIWLLVCCALVFSMVVLGGVTRLTRSGLSMVEWNPIMGVIPPLSQEQWTDTFEKYKQFPEYRKINKGMQLDEFKSIFWFEYSHRLLGRVIGMAFLFPFLYFLIRKRIKKSLTPKLVVMFILGGLQGLLGWYMVKSGLVDNPHVSQYRLTAHLGAAMLIYGYMLWVAVGLLTENRQTESPANIKQFRGFALTVTALICIMILSGGLVAGTKAGFLFNTFPKMNGHWLPPGLLSIEPAIMNLFENVATIQFNHRVLAFVLFLVIPLFWLRTLGKSMNSDTRLAANLLLVMLLVQVALGITTLLYVVPVALGAAHQAGALLLLSFALYLNHCLRKS